MGIENMGTIVDGMEYWEASTVQRDEEIKFLKHKNRYIEHDLRKAEDKNVQLYNEIDFLKNHIENLKDKYCKEDDDLQLDNLLRERISSLEDSYEKLRVKYKRNKSEVKELRRQLADVGLQFYDHDSESICSTNQGDVSEHFVEIEKYADLEKQLHQQRMISNQLQEQNDKKSEESMKQQELIGRLECDYSALTKEVNKLNQKATDSEKLSSEERMENKDNKLRIKELEVIINDLKLESAEKELSSEIVKNNINNLVDEVIQHLKETEIELELEPKEKITDCSQAVNKLKSMSTSLFKINQRVKQIVKEKSD